VCVCVCIYILVRLILNSYACVCAYACIMSRHRRLDGTRCTQSTMTKLVSWCAKTTTLNAGGQVLNFSPCPDLSCTKDARLWNKCSPRLIVLMVYMALTHAHARARIHAHQILLDRSKRYKRSRKSAKKKKKRGRCRCP